MGAALGPIRTRRRHAPTISAHGGWHHGRTDHHPLRELRDNALQVDLRSYISQFAREDSRQLPMRAHARRAKLTQQRVGTPGAHHAPALPPRSAAVVSVPPASELAGRGPRRTEGVQAEVSRHPEVRGSEQITRAIRHGEP